MQIKQDFWEGGNEKGSDSFFLFHDCLHYYSEQSDLRRDPGSVECRDCGLNLRKDRGLCLLPRISFVVTLK